MEKFGAHKIALVAFALLCSGMATASSGRPLAPTRRPPCRPGHATMYLTDLDRTRTELEAIKRRLATIQAILNNTETALAIEQAKNTSLSKQLREAQAGEHEQEAAKCHYLYKYTKKKVFIMQLERDNRRLGREIADLRAENEELRKVPGANKAITKHNANAAKSPMKEAAVNIVRRLTRSDTTVIHADENYQ